MFVAFGDEKLERIDSSTSSIKLAEWKTSAKTRVAYNEIFTNHELLTRIGFNVFKQYKEKELPTMHCAYILSICNILLNPKSSGINCNNKSVTWHVHAFLVNIHRILKLNFFKFAPILYSNFLSFLWIST